MLMAINNRRAAPPARHRRPESLHADLCGDATCQRKTIRRTHTCLETISDFHFADRLVGCFVWWERGSVTHSRHFDFGVAIQKTGVGRAKCPWGCRTPRKCHSFNLCMSLSEMHVNQPHCAEACVCVFGFAGEIPE